MRYAVSDHLGSPSSLTDSTGAVTERLSYDAWGMRRNASGSDALCGTISSATTRGFTGHETMDAVCLVNMNARLYDPAIGRFMSADPTVPNPFDGQSFNRYAYVENNPLARTDPTGFADQNTNGDNPVPPRPIDPCGAGGAGGVACADKIFDHGIPCYGCFGPGNVAGPNGRSIPIQALGFVTLTATRSDGTVVSGESRVIDLPGTLAGLGVPVNGVTLRGGGIFIDTTRPTEVTSSGGVETLIVHAFSGIFIPASALGFGTNGGFQNAAFMNISGSLRPSRQQMADDFAIFRSQATSVFLGTMKKGDEPASMSDPILNLNVSPTGQFFLNLPPNSQGFQDFHQFERDVGFNPLPDPFDFATQDELKLFRDAGFGPN